VQLSPGRRERWGEGVIRFSFYFSLSYSGLAINELPQVKSLLPMTVTGKQSLAVLIPTHKPSAVFSLPFPAEGEGRVTEWL